MFTARDVEEFTYCPRFIYFLHVMKVQPVLTYKMKKGRVIHEELWKKAPEENEEILRYYNLYLRDERLGLISVLDCLEIKGDEATPIDIKTGFRVSEAISDHHLAQLVAQAILVESQLRLLVRKIKVWHVRAKREQVVEIGIMEKSDVLRKLDEIREIALSEVLPCPTPHEAKCNECEFWRYCFRV
ncbi:MAG: CRISPR-associated protein Cas4 [Candidatus Helarchaeota archaeon]